MSMQSPLRTIRIPALQRQCLFRRQCRLDRTLAAPTVRAFTSTPQRAKQYRHQDRAITNAAAKHQVSPAPQVNLEKMRGEAESMTEDIGLLQGTIIRAPFKDLPSWYSGDFRSYFWKLAKAKFSGFYSRVAYTGCKVKKGVRRWWPVDALDKGKLNYTAKTIYKEIYLNFARGDVTPLKRISLPPLQQKLEDRIASRLPERMEWTLDRFKSCRVVSHRAALLGEDHPDTAYRQAVFRIVSVQSLTTAHRPSTAQKEKLLSNSHLWKPDQAISHSKEAIQPEKIEDVTRSTTVKTRGKTVKTHGKTVVEYLVLQKRVINGIEESWKAWGFTTESTMERVKEDEEYWQNNMDYQAAGGA